MIAEDHSKLVDKIFLKIFLKETTFAQTTYCTYACIRMCAGTSAHMSVLRVSFTRATLWKLESLVSRVQNTLLLKTRTVELREGGEDALQQRRQLLQLLRSEWLG